MATPEQATTCLIAGGGPAGMMLALLLARAGVDVTVMEKHADFLRDFRGDTVHASTLQLLDELGLTKEFAALPQRMIEDVTFTAVDRPIRVDLRNLPGPHKHIALVPQWDFLEMLARAAEAEPTFTLMRSTEVIGPLYEDGRVTGVTYRTADGSQATMRADLTVACDGRASTLRRAAGLRTRSFGAPMDVWWFRLPRTDADPHGLNGVFRGGHGMALIDRGDYYQVAYLIRKGSDAAMRAEGVSALQRQVATLIPWLAARVDVLTSLDEVKLLDVQLNRLRRWYRDGLLLIGDAAHAMSPIGGVGINLAIADAVAAGRILAGPLREHRVSTRDLARVQLRRWLPTAVIQGVQRVIQNRVIATAITADPSQPRRPSRVVGIITRFPVLRRIGGYGVAIGPLPEHAPDFARRAGG